MLQQFGTNIWLADHGEATVLGFRYPTRCAVIKLDDGGLFIWSPIPLTETLREAVDTIGPVQHIIAPNSLHHISISTWQQAYPNAATYAPPNLREKRKDLTFDADLTDEPPTAWAGQIEQVGVLGNVITTEYVFFHTASRTAIFADLLQQFPSDWHTGWRRVIAKLDLMTEPTPTVPRKFRTAFVNRSAARGAIAKILEWQTKGVIMAHGTPVAENGQLYLRSAFGWLRRGVKD